jgi:hypothetical protein
MRDSGRFKKLGLSGATFGSGGRNQSGHLEEFLAKYFRLSESMQMDYLTATVTPERLEFSPIVSISGTCPTDVRDAGTMALIWMTPAIRVGAAPAYWTCEVAPPMDSVTGSESCDGPDATPPSITES